MVNTNLATQKTFIGYCNRPQDIRLLALSQTTVRHSVQTTTFWGMYQLKTQILQFFMSFHPKQAIKISGTHETPSVIFINIAECILCSKAPQYVEAELRTYSSANYTIVGSNNDLSPGRRQAIIWTNAGILLIRAANLSRHQCYNAIWTPQFDLMDTRRVCLFINVMQTNPYFTSGVIW